MSLLNMLPDLYWLYKSYLFDLEPEKAHNLTIALMRRGLVPEFDNDVYPSLRTTVAGLDFPNPIGLAAGFDKQAEVIAESLGLGFGFAEVGGVVPLPQSGNPKPRLFRIREADAVINRMNFNSDGFEAVARRIAAWYDASGAAFFDSKTKAKRGVVGINIAQGDNCANAAEAFVKGLILFAPYLHYITINVSCPNSPDARGLEGREQLAALLQTVMAAQNALPRKPKVFVKISPDQTERQLADIAEVVLASGVHGIIVGNTTTTRPKGIPTKYAKEAGGLSGKPLFALSTRILADMYKLTKGQIPLIGSGGVSSGEDAYAKIRHGASLVQVYTALIFEGPYLIKRINHDIAKFLERDGFQSVSEAVGVDVK